MTYFEEGIHNNVEWRDSFGSFAMPIPANGMLTALELKHNYLCREHSKYYKLDHEEYERFVNFLLLNERFFLIDIELDNVLCRVGRKCGSRLISGLREKRSIMQTKVNVNEVCNKLIKGYEKCKDIDTLLIYKMNITVLAVASIHLCEHVHRAYTLMGGLSIFKDCDACTNTNQYNLKLPWSDMSKMNVGVVRIAGHMILHAAEEMNSEIVSNVIKRLGTVYRPLVGEDGYIDFCNKHHRLMLPSERDSFKRLARHAGSFIKSCIERVFIEEDVETTMLIRNVLNEQEADKDGYPFKMSEKDCPGKEREFLPIRTA